MREIRTKKEIYDDVQKFSKECSKCGERKSFTEYGLNKRSPDGRKAECNGCHSRRVKEHRWKNKDLIHRQQRSRFLERQYGISVDDYDRMLVEQGGCCAICKTYTLHGGRKYLSVDHDHVTGKVRGLLCNNCNAAIGLLGDDPQLVSEAAKYLLNSA